MATPSTKSVPPVTRKLSEHVVDLHWDKLPQLVQDRVKVAILDTMGCGIFGSQLPWGRIMIDFGASIGEGEEATIWGTNKKVPASQAALVNGTLVHSFEMDDLHKVAVIHPGAEVIPAVLAVSEKASKENRKVDGKAFLSAVAAGYEVGCRVGVASGTIQIKKGFHPSATSGVFAAAAGVAKLLDFNVDGTIHSLGIAGTQASGLMAVQYEAMVKRMNPGRSAQSGVYAGLLAQRGFTGITNVLEAPYGGFFTTFAGDVNEEDALKDIGENYEILNVGFKPYSCCGSNHTSIDVIKALLSENPDLKADQVEKIRISCTYTSKVHVGWDYEPSMTGAQMNLAYAVAVTMLDGQCFVDQYTTERIHDPEVLNLISKIEIFEDEELNQLGREGRHAIRLELKMKNGRVLKGERIHAKGSVYDPMTNEELIQKFKGLSAKVFPQSQVDQLCSLILNLEDCQDIRELSQLLQQTGD